MADKRRILRKIKITEISGVDNPCQEGARMTIMKRADDQIPNESETVSLSARLTLLKSRAMLLQLNVNDFTKAKPKTEVAVPASKIAADAAAANVAAHAASTQAVQATAAHGGAGPAHRASAHSLAASAHVHAAGAHIRAAGAHSRAAGVHRNIANGHKTAHEENKKKFADSKIKKDVPAAANISGVSIHVNGNLSDRRKKKIKTKLDAVRQGIAGLKGL